MPGSVIAAQLYTVREFTQTPADISKTLKRIRKIGYEAVQLSALGKIDPAELGKMLSSEGLACCATHVSPERLANIFAKAEASPDGCIRGFRHTMLDDSDVGSTRHARAAVGGLIGGLSGTGAVYVSGGAEHQGPPGGGPVAVIARV